MTNRIYANIAIALFFITLILRLMSMSEFAATPYFIFTLDTHGPDQHKFFEWAKSIYPGNGLKDHDFSGRVFPYAPLYPYLIALVFKLTTVSVTGVLILQVLLSSSLIFVFYYLGRHFNSPLAGICAASIWTFYGPSHFYDACLIRASLITSLAFLLFALSLYGSQKRGLSPKGLNQKWGLSPQGTVPYITGILLGLFTLLRPHILLIALPLWFLYRVGWRHALTVALLAMVVISPVALRNFLVSGSFVPVATQGVEALWLGNTPGGVGVGYHQSDKTLELEHASDLKVSKSILNILREFVKDPSAYAELYRRKIKMILNDYEVPGNYSYDIYRLTPSSRFAGLTFIWIFPFAVLGLLEGLRRRRELKDLYFFFLIFFLSALIIHIQSRYRLPFIPFLIFFAGLGIERMYYFLREKRVVPIALYTLLFIPLTLYAIPYPSYGKIMSFAEDGTARLNPHKIRDADYITLIFAHMTLDAGRYKDRIDAFADEALRYYGPFFQARYHLEYEKYRKRLEKLPGA